MKVLVNIKKDQA